jgi:hypothetical protein
VTSKKPKRARVERREQQRGLRKDVRAREKLAAQAPGGAPAQAITVTSASVIEGQARSMPCVQCGGTLDIEAHDADPHAGQLLRVVRAVCRLCHTRRRIWFRVEAPRAN